MTDLPDWPVAPVAIEPPTTRAGQLFDEAQQRGMQRSQPTFVGGGRPDVVTRSGHLPLGQSRVLALADLAEAERSHADATTEDAHAEEAVRKALEERRRTQSALQAADDRLRRAQATVAYVCGVPLPRGEAVPE